MEGVDYKPPYTVNVSKAIATWGDVDFINVGGQLLMPGVDADDPPYLEVIVPPSDDYWTYDGWKPEARWEIYRVEPEQYKLIERDQHIYMVPIEWAKDWRHGLAAYDWCWHKHLEGIANSVDSVDCGFAELRQRFCSSDPAERASAYIDLASVWGWYELDQYPLALGQHDVHLRYGMVEDCECSLCQPPDEEE